MRKLSFFIVLMMGAIFLFRGTPAPSVARADGGVSLIAISIRSAVDSEGFIASHLPLYAHLSGTSHTYFISEADTDDPGKLADLGLSYQILDSDPGAGNYYIAYVMPGQLQPDWGRFGRLLLEDGFFLLRGEPAQISLLPGYGVEISSLTLSPKPYPSDTPGLELPAAIVPDPVIQTMIDQVDSVRVNDYTGGLSGEWPVMIGGDPYTIATRNTYSGEPIEKAVQYTGEHLDDLGLSVEYHQWGGSTYPNVIGERTGLVNPDDIFIISAHLDDMPTGPLAPGADDNASGSTAVLIAADILTQYHWGCTLRFALWTGEEQGLLGSEAYAQRAYNNGENILGVLNLDMIAWNTPLSSRDIDLHANSGLPQTLTFAQLFSDVVDAYNLDLIPEIVPNGSSASDHASFWQYGYNAILGIEDFGDFNPNYHTTQDQLENLDLSYFTDFVKASVGTFAHLSNCLIPTSASWEKAIWIGDSGPFSPAEGPFGVATDEAVTIADSVSIAASGVVTFTLSEPWIGALDLVSWETGSGNVITDTNGIVWSVEGALPGVWQTITKTYQVSADNWITGTLENILWVDGADPQPDPLEVGFEHLWPEILVSPTSVEVRTKPDSIVTRTLVIENTGEADLDWYLPGGVLVSWLSIDPKSGTISPGEGQTLVLTFDAEGFVPGGSSGTLLAIGSNDPETPTVQVLVALYVDPWWIYLTLIRR